MTLKSNLEAQTEPRRGGKHTCGRPGKTTRRTAEPTEFRGHPTAIMMSRAERYSVQRMIEKLGDAAAPHELRLLEKVRVTGNSVEGEPHQPTPHYQPPPTYVRGE